MRPSAALGNSQNEAHHESFIGLTGVRTRMLVRVVDAKEASLAAAAGVDAIEIVADEPLDLPALHAVRLAFQGTLRLRLPGPDVSPVLAAAASDAGADEIVLPFHEATPPLRAIQAILTTVGIIKGQSLLEKVRRVRAHVGAVMLEPVAGRLMDNVGIAQLDALAFECRATSLPFGLAGGLEAPDVARLLLLKPDVLGFDVAVRVEHDAEQPLDMSALAAIRALIPRDGETTIAAQGPDNGGVDCIFVRDFAVSISIGAYRAEQNTRQQVRFSVEADVVRKTVPPRDMRDIFSYDVIIETIRVLSQRPHVTFVETLAEEVAAALLTHADLLAVKVKVEKLDVVDGTVGIEIVRRRSPSRVS